MDNKEFKVPNTLLTPKGKNNIYLKAVTKEFSKIHFNIFQNPDAQFYKSIRLVNKLLDESKSTDCLLHNKLEKYMEKINKIYCNYMTIDLEILALKNELGSLQEQYENGEI